MLYGYARVSTRDQNVDRQISALKNAGVEQENIFIDKTSGKNFNRPSYKKLLSTAQRNDIIIIKSIDRLGRDYEEIQTEWKEITKTRGIDIKVLDMPLLDTTYCKDILGTFISDLVFQVLSFEAEQERAFIKQRQKEGIAEAKKKGIKFRRPRKPLPDNFDELYKRYLNDEPISQLALECNGISESTLRLRIFDRQNGRI